jgi:predicted nucleic acid-binding protein
MTAVVVDTSVLIDVLRGLESAHAVLAEAATHGPLHASEVTRLEILAETRPHEEVATHQLLTALTWQSPPSRPA